MLSLCGVVVARKQKGREELITLASPRSVCSTAPTSFDCLSATPGRFVQEKSSNVSLSVAGSVWPKGPKPAMTCGRH